MSKQAYPLDWPWFQKRSDKRVSSNFRTGLPGALKNVQKSLELFGQDSGLKVTEILFSSNYSLAENSPADPGVAVYFVWDGDDRVMACDRYKKIEDNVQALHHLIEAKRTELRHGGLNFLRATMSSLAGLPPPGKVAANAVTDPWSVLGVSQQADLATVKRAYKQKAAIYHPDGKEPNKAKWSELQDAYNTIERSR